MENGIAIDTLHAQLLELSRREEYGFDMLRGQDWGKANSEKYNKMKSSFIRSMRMLAKKAPVKSTEVLTTCLTERYTRRFRR